MFNIYKFAYIKLTLVFVFVSKSITIISQDINKDFNKWSVGIEVGGHDGLNQVGIGVTRIQQLHHYGMNFRYMHNNRFGWKLNTSYDLFKWTNLKNPTHFTRVLIGPAVSLTDLLNYKEFTNRFGAIIYLGFGYAQMNSNAPYNNPLNTSNLFLLDKGNVDRMLLGNFGLTPQFKISERISLNADISFLFTVRQDRTFDYQKYIPPKGGTSSSFFNWSLGCTYYLGGKKKHADWTYSNLNSAYGIDTSRIITLEKQLIETQNKLNDNDKDGVINLMDEELDSKEGAIVNSRGVTILKVDSVDTDNDGVPDANDLCPLVKGKEQGCPDSDGDHVPDIIDGCPQEKGYPSANGCLTIEKQRIDLEKLGIFDVLFASGSSIINDSYKEILNNLSELMNDRPELIIEMIGYTDQNGSDEFNLLLSKRRVEACLKYIESKGINRSRLSISFKGESNSKYKGNTTESKAGNRRVSFKVQE